MSLYALSLIGGSSIGLVIAEFINDNRGYQWGFIIPTIFCAFSFVFMFFFMEETNYSLETVKPDYFNNIKSLSTAIVTDEKSPELDNAPVSIAYQTLELYNKTFQQKKALLDKPRTNNIWTISIISSGSLHGRSSCTGASPMAWPWSG
jgi:MFS family permease